MTEIWVIKIEFIFVKYCLKYYLCNFLSLASIMILVFALLGVQWCTATIAHLVAASSLIPITFLSFHF